ncbi:MAG: FapA family protein [Candidatus Latescibacterota bacterium]
MAKPGDSDKPEAPVERLLEDAARTLPDSSAEESMAEITAQPHGAQVPPASRPSGPPVRLDPDRVAAALAEVASGATLDLERARLLRARSVVAGEEVQVGHGALVGLGGRQVAAGRHVTLVGPGVFRAERYGYLSLRNGRLEVLSPLWVHPGGLAVSWLLLDEEPRPVTVGMVMQCLGDRSVVEGISRSTVEQAVSCVVSGTHECGAVSVALGRAPEHGQDGLVQYLLQVPGGQERQADVGIPVQAGQALVRRRVATRGVHGVTVHGEMLPARDGQDRSVTVGDNVQSERKGNLETLRAAAEGAMRTAGDTVFVVRVLTVRSSVNFDTGNLDFQGQIRIAGSVARGFSVRAEDAVVIGGSVEPGGSVQARGDVQVSGGIVGGRTRLSAGGSVWAGHVEEAAVTAGGDIVVRQQATRARLVAGGGIYVGNGSSEEGGNLTGGEAWGRRGIRVYMAGTRAGESTLLAAGLLPQQGERLDKINESLNTAYGQLVRHLERFGMTRLDMAQVQNVIAAATGPRRRLLVNTAQRLAELVRLYRTLADRHKQLLSQIDVHAQEAVVEILGHLHSGVTVRVGQPLVRVDATRPGPLRFHLVDGKLVDGQGVSPLGGITPAQPPSC